MWPFNDNNKITELEKELKAAHLAVRRKDVEIAALTESLDKYDRTQRELADLKDAARIALDECGVSLRPRRVDDCPQVIAFLTPAGAMRKLGEQVGIIKKSESAIKSHIFLQAQNLGIKTRFPESDMYNERTIRGLLEDVIAGRLALDKAALRAHAANAENSLAALTSVLNASAENSLAALASARNVSKE